MRLRTSLQTEQTRLYTLANRVGVAAILKFFGSVVGIIVLIDLLVVVGLLALIF
jgi:tetrahydromethanopterin S-methyltransferase subunit B